MVLALAIIFIGCLLHAQHKSYLQGYLDAKHHYADLVHRAFQKGYRAAKMEKSLHSDFVEELEKLKKSG